VIAFFFCTQIYVAIGWKENLNMRWQKFEHKIKLSILFCKHDIESPCLSNSWDETKESAQKIIKELNMAPSSKILQRFNMSSCWIFCLHHLHLISFFKFLLFFILNPCILLFSLKGSHTKQKIMQHLEATYWDLIKKY
jgi:hypothetical protein